MDLATFYSIGEGTVVAEMPRGTPFVILGIYRWNCKGKQGSTFIVTQHEVKKDVKECELYQVQVLPGIFLEQLQLEDLLTHSNPYVRDWFRGLQNQERTRADLGTYFLGAVHLEKDEQEKQAQSASQYNAMLGQPFAFSASIKGRSRESKILKKLIET